MTKLQVNGLPPLPIDKNDTPNWANFLIEHADYERKSSEYALSIIGKYPDKTDTVAPLANIALGSLGIFKELCEYMHQKGVKLMPETPQNLYIKQLNWLSRSGREERFLDKLVLGSIAESRCAMRFSSLAPHFGDSTLTVFYNQCASIKQQHAEGYLALAHKTTAEATVTARYTELVAEEEKVMAGLGAAAGIFY